MIYRLHKEGVFYLLPALFFLLGAVLLYLLAGGWWTISLASLALVVVIFFLIFFRNPKRRHGTIDTDLLLSPADGKVVVIERTNEPEYLKDAVIQVSIFMSPLNVHSNRSPVTGEVVYQQYHPGKYLVAWHPKSSELNERCTVAIERKGRVILLRQIAGKVARKIVTYTQTGDQVSRGEEFGFIKFGSRVDVFLPVDSEILVKVGDRVKGGISQIARLPG
jgi:phosphatidylserine decarboxylase